MKEISKSKNKEFLSFRAGIYGVYWIMTKSEAKKRIEKLKETISRHRYLYHVLDKQEISEPALDSLKHELYQLEQQFPEFITPDSPTQRVGGRPIEGFKKVKHRFPMLSIEDIFSEKELSDWEDYLKRLEPSAFFEYFAELKVDGFAISLVYKNGILIYGATRGNGRVGEDVTRNLKTIESIPLRLGIHGKVYSKGIEEKLKMLIEKGDIEIRGEVYMEKIAFEKFNQERTKKGESLFANPRNLAAGSIRQLNPKLAASRPLKFWAYSIVTDFGQETHFQEHQILEILGFKTDKGKECKNLKEIIDYWKNTAKKREGLPFQIDGIVINVNNNSLFKKLGVVGKSPRGIRAFKFSPKQATTILKNIEVQVGRTGVLTPVAILEPVKVEGVTVSRATLHNEDEIKRLGLKIGDTVIIGRAGDVIPDIIKVLSELRTGKERDFSMPKACPVCGSKTIRQKDEALWRCSNSQCFARQREGLSHFVSKPAFDISGLGPKIIDKLIDAGLISDAADLFKLKVGDILPLEGLPRRPRPFRKKGGVLRGFAEKSAKNLISAIQSKKKITLSRFLFSLGIRNVGERTAQDLADCFGSLDKLKQSSFEELENVRDIGPVVARSIYDWFSNPKNLELLKKLKESGVEVIEKRKPAKRPFTLYNSKSPGLNTGDEGNFKYDKEKPRPSGREYTGFRGKIFVLTGALTTMTRQQAKERILILGGTVSESVSKNTDFLVVGKEPGSKFQIAKKLSLRILTEKQFLTLLKQKLSRGPSSGQKYAL